MRQNPYVKPGDVNLNEVTEKAMIDMRAGIRVIDYLLISDCDVLESLVLRLARWILLQKLNSWIAFMKIIFPNGYTCNGYTFGLKGDSSNETV